MSLDISGISEITRIKITALHSEEDYLFLSYAVVSTDEFPLDIFVGIKEQLEWNRDEFSDQKLIGVFSGEKGDISMTFNSAPDFIDRYSVIEIDDGVNSEIHHLSTRNGNQFELGGLYNGSSLLNDYTNANVYLYYAIDFGMSQKEVLLPSITLWGFASGKQLISSEFDEVLDNISVTNQTYKSRTTGQFLNWEILIDCEERESYEILGILSLLVRICIGKRIIWVNGRKINIEFSAPAVEIESTENYDIVPKIQYATTVQIKEEVYNRRTLYKVQTIKVDVSILQED